MSVWYSAHITLFQTTAVYAILALSFQVVLRSGVFSFASVGFFGIGAYAAADLSTHGIGGIPTMLIVIAAMCGRWVRHVGAADQTARPVPRHGDLRLRPDPRRGGQQRRQPDRRGCRDLRCSPAVGTNELYIVAVLCLLLISQLERRSLGRSISVIRLDEQLARSMGVEVRRQRDFIFALSAALGGLAGVLYTFTYSTVAPGGFGFSLITLALTMAIVGGVVSWRGSLIGAILVVWFPQVFSFVGQYKQIVYGVLVILVVVYEPNGIVGLWRRGVKGVAWLWHRSGRDRQA